MKIAFNLNLSSGATGGGISFLRDLTSKLISVGHGVYFDLREDDLDLILILDPRWNHSNRAITSREILKYVNRVNPKVIIAHRINECDERKNTNFMNKKLRQINYLADSTVFVSRWLSDLNVTNKSSFHDKDIVIRNGANKLIYNGVNFLPWPGTGPLKLVTHHWSNNRMKGFDIYEELDFLLGTEDFESKFSFTYIGNLPKNFKFRNSVHVQPLTGADLALKIKEHHGYLTASINEPGGNHQNEGAACGLPILFRDSGCLPEYCKGYGVMFNENNFLTKLMEFRHTYNKYSELMHTFPNTAEVMVNNYIDYFESLLEKRDLIVDRRKLSRISPATLRLKFPL